jgi:ATP-binding cassette subfamily B protein
VAFYVVLGEVSLQQANPISNSSFTDAINKSQFLGIWEIMKGFRMPYFIATFSLALGAIAKTGTYLLLRYFVDDVLPINEKHFLFPWIALGFVVIAAIEGFFTFVSGKFAAYTAESVTRNLRNFVFDHIQRLSFEYHDKTKTGELIQRATSDIDALRRFFADQAIGIGRVVLLFLVNFIVIFKLNSFLAMISIIAIPFVIGISIFFFKKISKRYEEYQKQEAILSSTLQENLTGIRVVKAFARQEFEQQKFDLDNYKKYERGKKFIQLHSLYWPISDIISGMQMLLGFFIGALMTINGTITIGTYLAYSGLVVWLIWPMRNLGRLIVQTSTGLVSFKRVMKIISQPREDISRGIHLQEKLKGRIVFKSVYFKYDSQILALKDITFECFPGQTIALLGSTGSGKTSLVNLLPRFYEYSDGSITIDGFELRDLSAEYLRTQIGFVEQEPILFSRSIKDNIAYGVINRIVSQEQIEDAAKIAAIHEIILSFPNGYDTMIGERGVTLSGGQKQRIAIARTILKDPSILILDDSTSSVDLETEALIQVALAKLRHGRTTFIIAHRVRSIQNADLILVLDNGEIVQRGTHEELINKDGMYKKIFEIQTLIEDKIHDDVP